MAVVASIAIVSVIGYFIVFTAQAVRIIMGVAIYATEYGVVTAVGVAVGALVPFIVMPSAIYGEIVGIMVEGSRLPCVLIMTLRAIRRELSSVVVGVGGIVVIV